MYRLSLFGWKSERIAAEGGGGKGFSGDEVSRLLEGFIAKHLA